MTGLFSLWTGNKRLLIILLCFLLYLFYPDPIGSVSSQEYAIVQYATNRQYLCNALINVERLRRFETEARLVVLLPKAFLEARKGTPVSRLIHALAGRQVTLVPVDIDLNAADDVTYQHSFTKLEILRLPYKRVLYFDNDGLVLKSLDTLLLMDNESDLLLPEAYYTRQSTDQASEMLSSALMIIQPSAALYKASQVLVSERRETDFDMEIINQLSGVDGVRTSILPYRNHLLLTGLFKDHKSYIPDSLWDAGQEYKDAYYIHFSDSPMPKPWIDDRGASFAQHGPKCPAHDPDCEEVKIWRSVHNAFKDEMRRLCPSPKELD